MAFKHNIPEMVQTEDEWSESGITSIAKEIREKKEYEMIPIRFVIGLLNYSIHRMRVGSFLTACLENNLHQALSRADQQAQLIIPVIMQFIFQELPSDCWGNSVRVKEWLEEGERRRKNADSGD